MFKITKNSILSNQILLRPFCPFNLRVPYNTDIILPKCEYSIKANNLESSYIPM